MLKKSIFLVLVFAVISAFFISCNSDDDNTENSAPVNIEVSMVVDQETFTPGNTYEIDGQQVKIDIMQFYMSGIKMVESDGDETFAESYHIISSTNNSVFVGDLDIANGYDFSFNVGIDAVTNGQSEEDFSTRPADDPLAMQDPPMHWNWNSGYKFLRIDGEINGTAFKYHIGTDAQLVNLNIEDGIDVEEGGSNVIVQVDIEKFFNGIDVAAAESTMTMDNLPLATQVVGNYTAAFSVGQ